METECDTSFDSSKGGLRKESGGKGRRRPAFEKRRKESWPFWSFGALTPEGLQRGGQALMLAVALFILLLRSRKRTKEKECSMKNSESCSGTEKANQILVNHNHKSTVNHSSNPNFKIRTKSKLEIKLTKKTVTRNSINDNEILPNSGTYLYEIAKPRVLIWLLRVQKRISAVDFIYKSKEDVNLEARKKVLTTLEKRISAQSKSISIKVNFESLFIKPETFNKTSTKAVAALLEVLRKSKNHVENFKIDNHSRLKFESKPRTGKSIVFEALEVNEIIPAKGTESKINNLGIFEVSLRDHGINFTKETFIFCVLINGGSKTVMMIVVFESYRSYPKSNILSIDKIHSGEVTVCATITIKNLVNNLKVSLIHIKNTLAIISSRLRRLKINGDLLQLESVLTCNEMDRFSGVTGLRTRLHSMIVRQRFL